MITFTMMVEYTVAVASLLVVWLHRLFDNGSRKHGHFFACCSMFCFALALSWERIEDGFWPRQIFCSLRPRRIWFLGRICRNIIIRWSGWGSQEVRRNECRDYYALRLASASRRRHRRHGLRGVGMADVRALLQQQDEEEEEKSFVTACNRTRSAPSFFAMRSSHSEWRDATRQRHHGAFQKRPLHSFLGGN